MFMFHAMLDAISISNSNCRQMRRISRKVRCLVKLQCLAYQTQDERNSKDDLRFHLSALVFATLYTEIFKQPIKKSPRAMVGASYVSIVWHMPKLSIQRVDEMDACKHGHGVSSRWRRRIDSERNGESTLEQQGAESPQIISLLCEGCF